MYLCEVTEPLVDQVYSCALLNNVFWGIWALALLDTEKAAEPKLFNYDFAKSRVEMYNQIMELKSERSKAAS